MSAPWAAVVAVGNRYRRDDGVAVAAVEELRRATPEGVRLACVDGEPSRLMDAWDGVRLAVVVDAAVGRPAHPGRIHHVVVAGGGGHGLRGAAGTSSHGLGLPEAVELGRILDRLPDRLVLLTVEAADVGYGDGLTAPVEAALPGLVDMIRSELAASAAR